MDFDNDLNLGESYQKELIKILKPINYKESVGKFKEYDLIINDIMPIYYEVKADRWAHKYNSFCIEYEYKEKPSGICTTTADYYAYFIINPYKSYNLYIIPVVDIKDVINKNQYSYIKIGGDYGASKFYIINFSVFSMYKVI